MEKAFFDFDIKLFDRFPIKFENPIERVSFLHKGEMVTLTTLGDDSNKVYDDCVKMGIVLNRIDPNLYDSERELLFAVNEYIETVSNDLIGWNIDEYDIPYLVNRMLKYNIVMNKITTYDYMNIVKYSDSDINKRSLSLQSIFKQISTLEPDMIINSATRCLMYSIIHNELKLI